ncbi:MAG: DUF2807 domain-containing protein [Tannerellaceae bacterium]|jgi:hypothetical protein|nr:DUF2807 domain-containing protein [Tannerellaceae bacterium]
MKTKTSIFLIALLTVMTCLPIHSETIRGNKNIITKTVSIKDYDEVSAAGSMTFEYEQSEREPYFEITVDENIFPYIDIEVQGKKLIVCPKKDKDNRQNNSYSLNPTVYKIKSNSKELQKISFAGSGHFIVNSPLHTSSFAIDMAGSGKVNLTQAVTATNIKANMAGSGSINAGELVIDNTELNMAGSGKIAVNKRLKGNHAKLNLAGSGKLIVYNADVPKADCNLSSSGELTITGTVKEASYNTAGSGKINAYNCKANQVSANVTGSGRIELYAADQLNASIMGSGNITYKGSPSVKSSKSGSGSIRPAN